jgi:hypothetical protein
LEGGRDEREVVGGKRREKRREKKKVDRRAGTNFLFRIYKPEQLPGRPSRGRNKETTPQALPPSLLKPNLPVMERFHHSHERRSVSTPRFHPYRGNTPPTTILSKNYIRNRG